MTTACSRLQIVAGMIVVSVCLGRVVAAPRVLLPTAREGGSVWRYTTPQPAEGWTRAGFDDGSWAEGKSGFGVTDRVTTPETIGNVVAAHVRQTGGGSLSTWAWFSIRTGG